MLRGAKEGLGWGLGGYRVANYSRGETPISPKLLISLQKATKQGKLLNLLSELTCQLKGYVLEEEKNDAQKSTLITHKHLKRGPFGGMALV